jgi:hypothetical protein
MRLVLKFLVLSLFVLPVAAQASTDDAQKARVFITDSQSWQVSGSSGGSGGTFGGHMSGGARPQTAEIIKTFGQRCPQVVTNNKQDKADYIVVLDHEGGKSFVRHKNKVAVFNRESGDSVISKSTLSLGGSVQDACEAIKKDWSAHGAAIRAAEASAEAPEEKPAGTPMLESAKFTTSTTKLSVGSTPSAADIEIDGSFVGDTPSEIELAPGEHTVTVSKTGFKPWEKKLKAIGGSVNIKAELEAQTK